MLAWLFNKVYKHIVENIVCKPGKCLRALNSLYICHEHFCVEIWASNVNKLYIGIA